MPQGITTYFRHVQEDPEETVYLRRGPADVWLLGIVLTLVGIGLVSVYSSSALLAMHQLGDDMFYLRRQVGGAVLGLVALVVVSRIDYRRWRKLAYPLLALSYAAVWAVFLPKIGIERNGSARWINLGVVEVQPVELLKVTLIVWMAYSIAKKREDMGRFVEGYLPHVAFFLFCAIPLMMQPDFGSTVILGVMVGAMMLMGGVGLKPLLVLGAMAIPVSIWAFTLKTYRVGRFEAWLDPWSSGSREAEQLRNSLVAIAEGGLWGKGLGSGHGRLGNVPELMNDFIAASIAEELGTIGVVALCLLYAGFLWRGIAIARRARDSFGQYLALGLTLLVILQALINLMVATGLLPTKGLTLPFVSYGRTSLVILMAVTGVLLNIGQSNPDVLRAREQERERDQAARSLREVQDQVDGNRRSRITGRVR